MILELQKREAAPGISLIEFSGKLLMGNDSRQVEWAVNEMLAAGTKKIIFDLGKLQMVDSTGLGILVMCHARLQKAGGALRIIGAQGLVEETILMTHLDRLVPLLGTVEEARDSF